MLLVTVISCYGSIFLQDTWGGCRSGGRAGHSLICWWLDPWLLHCVYQSILGQDAEYVWMLARCRKKVLVCLCWNREGDSQSQTHETISDWPAGINRYGDHEKPKLALSTTHRLSAHIFLDIMANTAFWVCFLLILITALSEQGSEEFPHYSKPLCSTQGVKLITVASIISSEASGEVNWNNKNWKLGTCHYFRSSNFYSSSCYLWPACIV